MNRYCSPNISIIDYDQYIERLDISMGTEARRCNEVNVAGDFNTKSKAWGGAKTDRREPPCSYWDPVWLHISESLEEESPFIPPLIHSSCSLVLSWSNVLRASPYCAAFLGCLVRQDSSLKYTVSLDT